MGNLRIPGSEILHLQGFRVGFFEFSHLGPAWVWGGGVGGGAGGGGGGAGYDRHGGSCCW